MTTSGDKTHPSAIGASGDVALHGAVALTRTFHAGTPPRNPLPLGLVALLVTGLVVVASWATLYEVGMALEAVQAATPLAEAVLAALGLSAVALMVPAARAVRLARAAITAQAVNDLIQARVKGAESRNSSLVAMGFAGALVVVLLTVLLFVVNNLAVSRVFFYIPLISSSFWLMVKAFWINIYIFMVAEILVLIWGLVIAIARMAPGSAGRPVRMLATFYVDIFRSLPGIITIYLIGFGLPLTHLPVLKDLSQESLAIIALTLTNGAYTAEIYRAGIESIHWSQTAAARSLGLSYMQTLRYVVVPQGVRNIIPPMLNSFISLQKDTALVNVIGTIDAFNQSIIVASNNFNLSPVTTVALLFIAITIPQTRLVDRMIARDRRRMRIGGS